MEKEYEHLTVEQLNDILEFIKCNFSNNYNKKEQLSNLIKLSEFLKLKKYNIDEFDANCLLEKSTLLNALFSYLLKVDSFFKVLKIDNISLIANMYCLRENIDLNLEIEDDTKDLNLFNVYVKDLSQYGKLEPNEEHELAIRAFNGDIEARNLLVAHNLKFVLLIAQQYKYFNVSFYDIVQFGNEGLIVAANRFDPYRGVKFVTFAGYYVKHYISQGILNTNRVIRLPIYVQTDYLKINRETAKYLIESNGILPSDQELEKRLGISESRIREVREYSKPILSLSSAGYYNDDFILFDSIEDSSPSLDEHLNVEYLKNIVNYLKANLNNREADIIDLLYGFSDDEVSLKEIASIYGLTKERVRQIRNNALKRMKNIYEVRHNYDIDSYKTYL